MIMNKESLKNSVKKFGNNFFFNISAILIFSIVLNIDTESIILGIGVILNIIISKTMAFSSNNSFIQKYFLQTYYRKWGKCCWFYSIIWIP